MAQERFKKRIFISQKFCIHYIQTFFLTDTRQPFRCLNETRCQLPPISRAKRKERRKLKWSNWSVTISCHSSDPRTGYTWQVAVFPSVCKSSRFFYILIDLRFGTLIHERHGYICQQLGKERKGGCALCAKGFLFTITTSSLLLQSDRQFLTPADHRVPEQTVGFPAKNSAKRLSLRMLD